MTPRDFPVIFDFSVPGRVGSSYPDPDVPDAPLEQLVPAAYLRKQPAALPEVSELDVVRHYTRLSHRNFSIDEGFYPLGSCTMKYNPKIHEDAARLAGFARLHPYAPAEGAQGALRLICELEELLAEISGMDRVTFQPAAGAHGELTGLLMIRAYFETRGERRTKVIVPDSAHGTPGGPAAAVARGAGRHARRRALPPGPPAAAPPGQPPPLHGHRRHPGAHPRPHPPRGRRRAPPPRRPQREGPAADPPSGR